MNDSDFYGDFGYTADKIILFTQDLQQAVYDYNSGRLGPGGLVAVAEHLIKELETVAAPDTGPNCRCAVETPETCSRCRSPIYDRSERVSVGLKVYHRECYQDLLNEEDDRRQILVKLQGLERTVEKLSKEVMDMKLGAEEKAVCKGTACRI